GNAISHLNKELSKVRTGKASGSMFDSVMVDYYGNPTPIRQVSNVGVLDARTLTIQPWEKSMLEPIERAIFKANLGVTPQNDGEIIRIVLPMLTEERRREMVKQVKSNAEDAKVSIRNARRDVMDFIKKSVKDGYPEDQGKRMEDKVDNITKKAGSDIDGIVGDKEKDLMTV
ncbi:MAG: ribosome recycling factor, partial [Bacteroidota bacterium]